MKKENGHVTVTTKESRAGETTGRVRIILIVGVAIAIIGLIAIMAIWSQG
jgi:hypothetical protein